MGWGGGLRQECGLLPPPPANRKRLRLLGVPFIMSDGNIFKGQAES